MPSAAEPASLGHRPSRSLGDGEAQGSGDFSTSLSREATVRWLGHPPGGEPRLTVGGHSLTPAPTLNVDLQMANPMSTSPGELLAGGFGVIFATVLANQLVRDKTQASELVVQVTFLLSHDAPSPDPVLHAIRCHLEARVAGIDRARLAELGEQAMRRTIHSLAMNADAVSISLTIALVGEPAALAGTGVEATSVGAAGEPPAPAPDAPAIANGLVA